ncbi:unnamed protein product [Urochloa humidicola]
MVRRRGASVACRRGAPEPPPLTSDPRSSPLTRDAPAPSPPRCPVRRRFAPPEPPPLTIDLRSPPSIRAAPAQIPRGHRARPAPHGEGRVGWRRERGDATRPRSRGPLGRRCLAPELIAAAGGARLAACGHRPQRTLPRRPHGP